MSESILGILNHNHQLQSDLNTPKNSISRGASGALHELLVSADLMKMGYDVFRALSPASTCDLVILVGNKAYRVEVTTAWVRAGGKPKYHRHRAGDYDILAVVFHNGVINYLGEVLPVRKKCPQCQEWFTVKKAIQKFCKPSCQLCARSKKHL